MNTVRGESSNFFVHIVVVVVVVVQNANTSCSNTQILYQQKKEKKSEIFFSLFLLCERGVLDKIQLSKKRKSLYNAHAPLTLSKTIG